LDTSKINKKIINNKYNYAGIHHNKRKNGRTKGKNIFRKMILNEMNILFKYIIESNITSIHIIFSIIHLLILYDKNVYKYKYD